MVYQLQILSFKIDHCSKFKKCYPYIWLRNAVRFKIQNNNCTVTVATDKRAPRWTFTDPCKPEVRSDAQEESASPDILFQNSS